MAALAPVKISSILDITVSPYTNSTTVGSDSTLSPEGISPQGVAKWVNRAGGIPIGYPALTMSVRPPTKVSRNYKVTVKYVSPTLEQTSPSTATGIQPAPTKAYDLLATMEFILPERSTLAERNAFLRNVASLFFRGIRASDGAPDDVSASPLELAVTTFENVY
jgi:hypothetical protein